jgi:hypothetical protein
MSITPNVTL